MFGGPQRPPSDEELNAYRAQANKTVQTAIYIAIALWSGKFFFFHFVYEFNE